MIEGQRRNRGIKYLRGKGCRVCFYIVLEKYVSDDDFRGRRALSTSPSRAERAHSDGELRERPVRDWLGCHSAQHWAALCCPLARGHEEREQAPRDTELGEPSPGHAGSFPRVPDFLSS